MTAAPVSCNLWRKVSAVAGPWGGLKVVLGRCGEVPGGGSVGWLFGWSSVGGKWGWELGVVQFFQNGASEIVLDACIF